MRLDKMKDVRSNRGLTQTQLAERIDSNQSYVSKIERGMTVPKRVAERIAGVLLCDVSDLVRVEEPTLTFKVSELPAEVLALLKK
jgi:transcriptional regulator with XRE-family HTH domain